MEGIIQRLKTYKDPDLKFEIKVNTVKFLKFGTPEIFAVIYLKFKQRGQTLRVFCQNGANGIANSEKPYRTAPRDCSSRSSLIWVCTVCPDLSVRKLLSH